MKKNPPFTDTPSLRVNLVVPATASFHAMVQKHFYSDKRAVYSKKKRLKSVKNIQIVLNRSFSLRSTAQGLR